MFSEIVDIRVSPDRSAVWLGFKDGTSAYVSSDGAERHVALAGPDWDRRFGSSSSESERITYYQHRLGGKDELLFVRGGPQPAVIELARADKALYDLDERDTAVALALTGLTYDQLASRAEAAARGESSRP